MNFDLSLVVPDDLAYHLTCPGHVSLAVAHAVDVAFQFLVGVDRHVLGEVLIVVLGREQVVAAILRVGPSLQQVAQHGVLQCLGLRIVFLQRILAGRKQLAHYFC